MAGGVFALAGVSAPGGSASGVSVPGGGCLVLGVVPGLGDVCSWGVSVPGIFGSAPRGGVVSQHALRQTPL